MTHISATAFCVWSVLSTAVRPTILHCARGCAAHSPLFVYLLDLNGIGGMVWIGAWCMVDDPGCMRWDGRSRRRLSIYRTRTRTWALVALERWTLDARRLQIPTLLFNSTLGPQLLRCRLSSSHLLDPSSTRHAYC